MPLPIREPHDLVLERRAIARTDALNLPVEQRAAGNVAANQIADALVGVHQPAVNLISWRFRRVERKRHRHFVSGLVGEHAFLHARVEVDAPAIETRRRSGFQPAHLEAERTNRIRQLA